MASITIRNLDDALKDRLRVRAARRGHSMEEELRQILKSALAAGETGHDDLAARIRCRMEGVGGVDLPLPPREMMRQPPDLAAADTEA